MAYADFEEFCAQFCANAGIEPPELTHETVGCISFSVRIRGVLVTALHLEDLPDTAFLMAELGAMPELLALEGWRALMEANLFLIGQDAPVFSRNPDNGEVVLQRSIHLCKGSLVDTFDRLDKLVEVALQWLADRLLPEAAPDMRGSPASIPLQAMA